MQKIRLSTILLRLLLFCAIAVVTAQAPAQPVVQNNPYAQFGRITTKDGLSHNQIIDILQDHHHYLWIATANGLNRYDGNVIKTYSHNTLNISLLPEGAVTCLAEEENGTLWVGTENGLYHYDRRNDRFILLPVQLPDKKKINIRALLAEANNIIWTETVDGYLLKISSGSKSLIKSWKHAPVWQPYYYYHTIFRDSEGVLWMGGRGSGLYYLDENRDCVTGIPLGSDPGNKIIADVAIMMQDSNRTCWVGAIDGLFRFDIRKHAFTKILKTSTFDIIEPEKGVLWLATGNGILEYNIKINSITRFRNDINNPGSLPDNFVLKICADSEGTLWIATHNGLAYYRSNDNQIKTYYHIPENAHTPASNRVSAAMQDSRGAIWIGYRNHGLDKLNPADDSITHYKASPQKPGSLPSNNIRSLYEDNYGDLYIGLWEGVGFSRKKKNTEKFELFTYYPGSSLMDWYYDFAEDNMGQFYTAFWGADGLQTFDRKTGKFKRKLRDKFTRPYESRLVTRLFSDSKGILWVGTTQSGVHLYNPLTDTSACFYNQKWLGTTLEKLSIYDIAEDNKGNIWLAADSLFCYTPGFDALKVWGLGKGLSCRQVFTVIPDKNGNLWLGTEKGIICFNPAWNYSISVPELSELQQSEECRAGVLLNDGRILVGSQNGFAIFDPEGITSGQHMPDIFLTELQVKGRLHISDLNDIERVELKHHENYFSVGFSCTDLAAANTWSFRYRLNGFEQNWNASEKSSTIARYTNVPPGDYTLEIQMTSDNSNWKNIRQKSLPVTIHFPFWKQWWFIMLVTIILITATAFIIRENISRIRLREKNATLKELLLRAQINPHFIFNALVAIQRYIYQKDEREAGRYLAEFSKLIRLTLDNTRQEYVSLDKELQLMKYYLTLQQLRFDDRFTYDIMVDEEIDPDLTRIPPMLAQPFIENAIEHGLAGLTKTGHINISIRLNGKLLIFTIDDNGIGRKAALNKNKAVKSHISYGTEITQERLDYLRRKYKFNHCYPTKMQFRGFIHVSA